MQFDGPPKLHIWTFNSAAETAPAFSAAFLPSKWWNDTLSAQAFVPVKALYGPNPPWTGVESTVKGLMEPVGNQNINTWKFGAQGPDSASVIGATTDAAILQALKIEPNSDSPGRGLKSAAIINWQDDLGEMALLSCAHPAHIPGTNDVTVNYFGTLSLAEILGKPSPSSVKVALVLPGSTPDSLRRVPFASWNTTAIRYVHSFAITKTHAMFLFPPVTWNETLLAFSLEIGPAMLWNATGKMQLVAVPLPSITESGAVTQQPTFMTELPDLDPFFPLHMGNAWNTPCSESDLLALQVDTSNCTRVTFEGAGYGDLSVLTMFMMDIVHNTTAMNEQNLNLNFKRVSAAIPTAHPGNNQVNSLNSSLVVVEDFSWTWPNGVSVPGPTLPRWNRRMAGQRTCFLWGLQSHVNGSKLFSSQAVMKFDTCAYEQGDTIVHQMYSEPGIMFAEPVFVPRPQGHLEDDGVVLVDAYNTELHSSALYVLDGSTMELLAILQAPVLVPFPVHAEWYWTT